MFRLWSRLTVYNRRRSFHGMFSYFIIFILGIYHFSYGCGRKHASETQHGYDGQCKFHPSYPGFIQAYGKIKSIMSLLKYNILIEAMYLSIIALFLFYDFTD